MNARNLITGVVAGIIVFAWGMISWMALPFHGQSLSKLNGGPAAAASIQALAPESGMYAHPGMHASKEEKMKPPRILVAINYKEKNFATCMAIALLINILAALALACLISKSNQEGFKERMQIVCKAVAFVALVGLVPNWLYWGFTVKYTLLGIIDLIIGWGLAGAWIAKRV